jgi:Sulfatase-modifying factor enzyme 1/PEGA domain
MNNKITNEDIENASVKLKPIFGIKPGYYLTIIYSILLLIVLFLIFVTPGIKKNGAQVTVDTFPDGAAVYVDNVYMGTSPVTFFVKKGDRQFRIFKDFFKTTELTEKVKGRLVGSLIFPRKITIEQNIELIDTEGFFEDRFKELSSYALIENYYDRYQMPPLLSRTVREYLSGSKSENNNMLYDFLYSMRLNLSSVQMLEDYAKSISLVLKKEIQDDSQYLSGLSLIFDYFQKENNNDTLLLSILNAFPEKDRDSILKLLSSNGNIKDIHNRIIISSNEILSSEKPEATGKSILINNGKFIEISEGRYFSSISLPENSENLYKDNILTSFPHIESTDRFYIMEKEVSTELFAQFVKENPEWSPDNIDFLIQNNLATKDYLKFIDLKEISKPVSNISWYAATAYCEWLTSKLPESLSNYTIKLPSEAEWEAAARADISESNNYIFKESGSSESIPSDFSRKGKAGLYDILGNLWEWNENWVFPGDSINGEFGLSNTNFEGSEKAVRGGSWANSNTEITYYTRGSQEPTWCTPFLGFRPVMVKK